MNDIYVVLEGSRLGGVYKYREDAVTHAQAIGGTVITQQVKTEVPTWVTSMVEAAQEKAKLQNPTRR